MECNHAWEDLGEIGKCVHITEIDALGYMQIIGVKEQHLFQCSECKKIKIDYEQ